MGSSFKVLGVWSKGGDFLAEEEVYFEEINLRNGFYDVVFVLGLVFIASTFVTLLVAVVLPGAPTGVALVSSLVGVLLVPGLVVFLLVARKLGFVWTPKGLMRRPL